MPTIAEQIAANKAAALNKSCEKTRMGNAKAALSKSVAERNNSFVMSNPKGIPTNRKLADIQASSKTLKVRPLRRSYHNEADAGYDWSAGVAFVITDPDSPLNGQITGIHETKLLRQYNYDAVAIQYNRNAELFMELDGRW